MAINTKASFPKKFLTEIIKNIQKQKIKYEKLKIRERKIEKHNDMKARFHIGYNITLPN